MLRQKKILEYIVGDFHAQWLHFLNHDLQELLVSHLLIKVPDILSPVNLIFFKFPLFAALN